MRGAMSAQVFTALLLFAFVSSITPGPNNLMVLASGVNFGFRRTVPHMLGVAIGFTLMVAAVGFGMGAIFTRAPFLYTALKIAGVVYLLVLAFRLAMSGPVKDGRVVGAPMSFFSAMAFQWVNPKAYVMAVSAVAAYASPDPRSILLVTLAFALVTPPCISTWAAFGTSMRRVLTEARYVRPFNIVMALLLVASLVPVVEG
jgi:threonine/homoserine/homoserine lactone efflux protein